MVENAIKGVGVGVEIGKLALDYFKYIDAKEDRADTIASNVCGFSDELTNKFKIEPCNLIIKSNQKCEMSNVKWLCNFQIAGKNFSVYQCNYGAVLKYNGEKGFDNWCVQGDYDRKGNTIYVGGRHYHDWFKIVGQNNTCLDDWSNY